MVLKTTPGDDNDQIVLRLKGKKTQPDDSNRSYYNTFFDIISVIWLQKAALSGAVMAFTNSVLGPGVAVLSRLEEIRAIFKMAES